MKCKYKKFLKAAYINYEEDYCGSGSGTFTKPTVTTPIIVITGTTATIACAISGATIYYTLDGSTPTSSSTEYTGAITLTLSCTIKAIAVKLGMSDSAVASESYVHYLTQWKIVGNSEVHTLPYPDGVVLPNGYKRCEYLKFDGNSYINTGVKTANDIGYNLSILTESSSALIIGARKTISGQVASSNFVLGALYNTKISYGYGGETQIINFSNSYAYGVKHNIVFDNTTFKIDNDIININKNVGTDFYDIYIGTWNGSNSPDYRYLVGNLYDTIIYNSQGELWHGIPCLDANNVPCFYDIVSQTAFYNQGSGSFTYKLYPQPTEIWSCGEYNATDGKYHILVQPQGGSVADIALDEPLRKVNDVADSIEFVNGVATLTRNLIRIGSLGTLNTWTALSTGVTGKVRWRATDYATQLKHTSTVAIVPNILCSTYPAINSNTTYDWITNNKGVNISTAGNILIIDEDYSASEDYNNFIEHLNGVELIGELATPTTELVDAPQIEEAESYSCVISQGGKAVSWSSFETE